MEEVRKAVHCIQTGKKVTDQFYVDEDVNVPDVREDVAKVILAGGRVRVEDIKMTENYARITGKITYQINSTLAIFQRRTFQNLYPSKANSMFHS